MNSASLLLPTPFLTIKKEKAKGKSVTALESRGACLHRPEEQRVPARYNASGRLATNPPAWGGNPTSQRSSKQARFAGPGDTENKRRGLGGVPAPRSWPGHRFKDQTARGSLPPRRLHLAFTPRAAVEDENEPGSELPGRDADQYLGEQAPGAVKGSHRLCRPPPVTGCAVRPQSPAVPSAPQSPGCAVRPQSHPEGNQRQEGPSELPVNEERLWTT